MPAFKSISAIIITFNPDIEKINRQLFRLLNQVENVILVDNASENTHDLVQLIESEFASKNVFCIRHKKNEGLGFAQNVGIKKAIALGSEKIILMDDDSSIEDNFVDELLKIEKELTEKGEKIGAIGPIYFNKETNEQYPVTKYKGPFIQRQHPKNEPIEASFLISSGTLISIDVIKDVGLMNEDLFIDYIDVDWSFRARKKGYRLFVAPNARMNHIIGEKRLSVFGRKVSYHSALRKYYLFRNSIYMIKNPDISTGYKIREIIFNFIRFFVYLFYSDEKKNFIKYSFAGICDGLKGKMGKCEYNY